MLMRAPILNHIVSLQQRGNAINAAGQRDQNWVEIERLYARVIPLQGRALLAAQALHAEVTSEVFLRYRDTLVSTPLADLRIEFRGRYLTIHAALDLDESRRYLRLSCAEGAHES